MRILFAVALLSACSQRVDHPKPPPFKPASPVTQAVGGNEIVVMEVPLQKDGYVDVQRCFVWRDKEFKTAALSCPSGSIPIPSLDPPD